MTKSTSTSKKTNKSSKDSIRMRQRRRGWLTFVRMCRYGINNFSRNAWLTIAATAVMSVTLIIVFMTLSARQILVDTVSNVSRRADMSIYLKGDTPKKDVDTIKSRIEKLDNVDSVKYISAAEARDKQAEQYKDDPEALEAIRESSNEMSATLRVSVKELNNQQSLNQFIKSDKLYKKYKDSRREPSFSGERQQAIKTVGSWVRLAGIGGSIATVVFVVISSLVVFNTIRMAIFNRKDEIEMMKLIGAERSFIRGPFIVEAIMYGFIAAIIATVAGYSLLFFAHDPMTKYGIPVDNLLGHLTVYGGLVFLGMILVGATIGVVSSWVATRKYLKL